MNSFHNNVPILLRFFPPAVIFFVNASTTAGSYAEKTHSEIFFPSTNERYPGQLSVWSV